MKRILALLLAAAGCLECAERHKAPDFSQSACRIQGPVELAPLNLTLLRIGMPKREVDRLLGPPVYSPTDSQYYYSTGGDCPLDAPGGPLLAPCGVVADYRVIRYPPGQDPIITLTGHLESCWWGAIGE